MTHEETLASLALVIASLSHERNELRDLNQVLQDDNEALRGTNKALRGTIDNMRAESRDLCDQVRALKGPTSAGALTKDQDTKGPQRPMVRKATTTCPSCHGTQPCDGSNLPTPFGDAAYPWKCCRTCCVGHAEPGPNDEIQRYVAIEHALLTSSHLANMQTNANNARALASAFSKGLVLWAHDFNSQNWDPLQWPWAVVDTVSTQKPNHTSNAPTGTSETGTSELTTPASDDHPF